jgi:DNA-damage-inducible protein D
VLEYETWRSSKSVIAKVQVAAEQANRPASGHFAEVGRMVSLCLGIERWIEDFRLSRYACHLIVQNGDPSEPVIANGRNCFAVQKRRQELLDSSDSRILGLHRTGR